MRKLVLIVFLNIVHGLLNVSEKYASMPDYVIVYMTY